MKRYVLFVITVVVVGLPAIAQVKYDEGRLQLLGVQLLQDYKNEKAYYYLPQYPRLSVNPDGQPELLCIKYVGEGDQPSGGLFHALMEFSLPDTLVLALQTALEEAVPGAVVMGPVPLLPLDGEGGAAGFQIVSGVLSDAGGETSFTRSLITSGYAPLLPGSKSAIAANLTPEGATLLWNSFTGPTSDVSASVHACYEAWVNGYNAMVSAEMNVIYDHFSQLYNVQENYSKREIRDIVDNLKRDGKIKVEVFDRSKGLDIPVTEMERILNLVTDKLVEVMFNTETGWSKSPEKEEAVTAGQIQGRQQRGWITKLFKGSGNAKYYTDDQFVLKKRTDVQTNTFYLNLSKSTTIKVPVHTSGNLGGVFESMGSDPAYFRIVDLDDAAFQYREVFFQIDGEFVDAFRSKINFVSVNFRKQHKSQPATTKEVFFNYSDIENGNQIKQVSFPRLGEESADWLKYDYKLNWSIRGLEAPLQVPAGEEWIQSDAPVVSLIPPFVKAIVEIDADRTLFIESGIATAIVEFASVLAGNKEKVGRVVLRADDPESLARLSLFHDAGEPVAYQITWVSKTGSQKSGLQLLDTDYLFLIPPSQE